eukprot:scaffold2599_cov74-Phaeocystis_antarctica.AAC.3
MASKRARWRNWSSHLSSVLLLRQVTFVGSRPFGAACCSRAWVKTVEPWGRHCVRGLSLRATVIAPARVCCSVVAFDNCKPEDLLLTIVYAEPLKLLDDEGEIHYQRNPSGYDDHGTEELEEVTVLDEDNPQVAQELCDLLEAKHLGSFSQRISGFMGIDSQQGVELVCSPRSGL